MGRRSAGETPQQGHRFVGSLGNSVTFDENISEPSLNKNLNESPGVELHRSTPVFLFFVFRSSMAMGNGGT